MRTALIALCLLTVAQVSAAAEPSGSSTANAEALFQQGKEALLREDYEAACPMFEESYRLDRAGGTLQNLAYCYESAGKQASAYARWQELKTLAKRANRGEAVELAEQRLSVLYPKLSRAHIDLPAGNNVPGLKVRIDQVEYGATSWSAGILLDPGQHELVVSAPDHKSYQQPFLIEGEGSSTRLRVPKLTYQPKPNTVQRSGKPLRTAGLVTGGAGLVFLAGGGVAGLVAMMANNRANEVCAAGAVCASEHDTDRANGIRGDARLAANLSNVFLPIGLVGVAAGAVLFWQGKKVERGHAASVWVTPGIGGLTAGGVF